MPNALVKSFAKKSGKSVAEVEERWEMAERIVKDEYGLTEKSKNYYPRVVGVLKKSLGINESISFTEYDFLKNYNTEDTDNQ